MESGLPAQILSNDNGRCATMYSAVSRCFADWLMPHQIGKAVGSLQETTRVTPQSLEKSLRRGPSESASAASYPRTCGRSGGKTGLDRNPPVSKSQHCSFVSAPAPASFTLGSQFHLTAQEGPEALRSQVCRPWLLAHVHRLEIPSQSPSSLQEKLMCRGEHMVVRWMHAWSTCRPLGPLWTCAPASSRVIFLWRWGRKG